MSRYLFGLFVLLLLNACVPRMQDGSYAPTLTCINLIDQNGTSETISSADRLQRFTSCDFLKPQPYQKVLRVYSRDECGNVPSVITSYYPNGVANQYLEVENGRAKGNYLEWFQDGTQKICAYIVGGVADLTSEAEKTWLFDGLNQAWDEDGRLLAELQYCKGSLQGLCVYYHKNGCVWKKVTFQRDQIDGVAEIYLDNGEIFQTTTYSQGLKNGPSIRYWCEGKIAAEESYCWGKLDDGSYFDRKGKQIARIEQGKGWRATFGREGIAELQEYNGGMQEGAVQVFAKGGTVVQTYCMKNGIRHGEEYWYYEYSAPNPKPKLMLSWYDGKVQGVAKTWYPNGNQESQREMSGNTRNGLSTAWYEDGSLMLIEQYEKDKLNRGEYYKKGDFIPVSQITEGKGTATLFDADGSFLRKIDYVNGHPDDVS